MSLNNIFKNYDIRGLVPEELDEHIAHDVGRAMADFLSEEAEATRSEPLVVARDMRADSAALATAATEGIRRQGRDVVDIGQVTTDMLYFAVAHLNAAGGMVVTASHNPGQYNGIKLCREQAVPISQGSGLENIKHKVINGEYQTTERGGLTGRDIAGDWVDHALSFTGKLRPYRLAVDAGNGMAGAVIPKLAGKTPLEITPMYFELDGSFPNHEANPMKVETLQELRQKVKSSEVDFGLAFDGDGDRMGLVDELGRPVDGSTTFALLAWSVLEKHPEATIVHDLRTSRSALEFIAKQGGRLVRTRVGNPSVKKAMREHQAPFGGETTGHYVLRDNYYIDSGLVAALMAIDTISARNLKLCDFADEVNIYARSEELNFTVDDARAVLKRLAAGFSDGEQDFLDGLTVNYPNWWFNARPSNTEPLLRLNVEAEDKDSLNYQVERLTEIINSPND